MSKLSTKTVVWPSTTLLERLRLCSQMLHVHDLISDGDWRKIARRINDRAEKERSAKPKKGKPCSTPASKTLKKGSRTQSK